jgi:NAD-dependent dihydropyrimidine dehydrogenase PreA subunit
MTVWIDAELCNGCKRCVKACPYEGVEMREGKAHILDRCTSCGACIESCKQNAILTDAKPREYSRFQRQKRGMGLCRAAGRGAAFGLPGTLRKSGRSGGESQPGRVGGS